MKDIFIDTNIAKNFATPVDLHYKKLVKWILAYNDNINDAYLVLSKKLMNEYLSSSQNCSKSTSMPLLIIQLTREGRINNITNANIKAFKAAKFNKNIEKKLRSNSKDRDHIPVILLSNRKLVITKDVNFSYDLVNFPRYSVTVTDCPSKIDYT